jgi:3-keto-5-aminohexanoate cleavage enzyme
MEKVIINLCPTGMVPTKTLTPHVPITVDEIVQTSLKCADMGASIIHIHPRDKEGNPTWKKSEFEKIIAGIKEKNSEVLISVTTSGRDWSEFEKRSECLEIKGDLKPDLASLTVGSLNFISQASVNGPQMIEDLAMKMKDNGIKPELEIFEPGMIHKAKVLMKKGIIDNKKPYFNILFGSLGTSPLEPSTIASMHALLPEGAIWSIAGIGAFQLDANTIGLALGGNIRVGLEDNIFFDKEKIKLATNEELLERVIKITKLLGREIATTKETREMIGL